MARPLAFIHAADVHLGAPMRGFRALSQAWQARLVEAIGESYDRMIGAAIAREVDFVVLAGDMFDTSRASYGDFARFFEGLHRLDRAGIPAYLVTGNHDPFTSWQRDVGRLPASARILGAAGDCPEFALFERDGEPLCLIGGRGYYNQAWPLGEDIAAGITRTAAIEALRAEHPRAGDAPFTVGIVHTGLDIDQSKASTDPAGLIASDIDYWACGHLHKRLVLPDRSAPRAAFPGCLQGRDLRESGERGCFLVTMEQAGEGIGAEGTVDAGAGARARVLLEFLPMASIVFHTVKVDVSACRTLADIARLVQAELFGVNGNARCEEMVVRVVLEGTTALHSFLTRPAVIDDLRKRINDSYPSFFCDALVDRTRRPRDRDAIRREGLFAASVLRVSDQQRARDDEMVNYVQAEFVKRGIDVPGSLVRRIGEFGDAAEAYVFDLLEEEPQ